jgi:PKHD-type hydroxylase
MIHVFNLLDRKAVRHIRKLIEDAPKDHWSEGSETAGPTIRHRKSNKQMMTPPKKILEIIDSAMKSHPSFNAIAMPCAITGFMVSRYSEGDGYDFHMDASRGFKNTRRDLSLSICLSDPDEFEGGELVFSTGSIRPGVKLDGGQAAMFESHLEHSVNPITKGVRYVAIAFIESIIRDPIEREICFRLGRAMRLTEDVEGEGKEELVSCISYAQENCGRKWIDT